MSEAAITVAAVAVYALACIAAGKFIGLYSGDERASDGEADLAGRQVQGVRVHGETNAR